MNSQNGGRRLQFETLPMFFTICIDSLRMHKSHVLTLSLLAALTGVRAFSSSEAQLIELRVLALNFLVGLVGAEPFSRSEVELIEFRLLRSLLAESEQIIDLRNFKNCKHWQVVY